MALKATPRQAERWAAESQNPTFQNVPQFFKSCDSDVINLGRRCGIEPQPWQANVTEGIFGEKRDGSWSAEEVAIIVSRQNGKGTEGELRILAGIGLFEESLIFWTAQVMPTTLEAMKRIIWAVTNCDDLRKEVKKIVNINGQEAVEFYGTSRRTRITEPRVVRFSARTTHQGRGFAGASCIVFDEAYALTPDQIAAIMPTLGTMSNTQLFYLSSPPLDIPTCGPKRTLEATQGMQLFALRKRALAGDKILAYYEWSPPDGWDLGEVESRDPDTGEYVVDLADAHLAYRTNPALGHLLQFKAVQREHSAMTRRVYARERLGAWPPAPIDASSEEARVISPAAWKASRTGKLTPGDTMVIGIDSAPSRTGTSIVAYWLTPEGHEAMELIDYAPGIGWVPGRLREIADEHNPMGIAFDERSQIGAAVGELTALGFKAPGGDGGPKEAMWGDLWVSNVVQLAAATTGCIEAINGGGVRHGGQVELSIAVSNVALRDIGEGLKAFSRKNSGSDISPLNGWALARQCWRDWYGVVQAFDPFGAYW